MIRSRLNQSKLWKLHLVNTYLLFNVAFANVYDFAKYCLELFTGYVIELSDFIFSSLSTSGASNDQGSEIYL